MSFRPRPPRFVGLDNYTEIATSLRFWTSIWTTALITFVSVAVQYALASPLRLRCTTTCRERRFKPRDLFSCRCSLPLSALALIARMIFHPYLGPVNDLMGALGFAYVPFLTEKWPAIMVLAVNDIWQWTPFVTLLMLAGLQGLPQEVFEAARVDNIGAWRRFWGITFPMLLPLSVAVVFIRLIEGFKIIDTVFVLTGGGRHGHGNTDPLATTKDIKKFNLGLTSALSFMFPFVVIIFGTVYLAAAQRVTRRYA